MSDPDDRRYHRDHSWAKAEGDVMRVGITDHAQDELDTVVYVELPEIGAHVDEGRPFGEIESNKTVSDLVAPVAGTVRSRNDALTDDPELVNRDPYGEGWMIVLEPDDTAAVDGLLTVDEYRVGTSTA